MQTRMWSLIEVVANVMIGAYAALLTQMLVFPLYGIAITLSQNIEIMVIFTVVSVLRSYIMRRFFVWLGGKHG